MPLEKLMETQGQTVKRRGIIKSSLVALIIMLFALPSSAQTMELGLFGGGSYYIGDMNPAMHFKHTQIAYGALARFNVNRRWAFKVAYSRGKIKGDDATVQAATNRGLNFKSTINDISAVAEFNFWEYFTGSKKNYFTPYIYAGIAFFTFKPTSLDGVALQPLGTEGQNVGFDGRSPYNKWGVAFPFGFGFKYSVSEKVGLAFEWGMRKTFTDYLDDVSSTYYLVGSEIDPNNAAQVHSDPTMIHEPYMQRGDSKTWDWYSFFGVTVTYKINLRSRLKCNLEGW